MNFMYRRQYGTTLRGEERFRFQFFFLFSFLASFGFLGSALYHMIRKHSREGVIEGLLAISLGVCLLLGNMLRRKKSLRVVYVASVGLCHLFAFSMLAYGGDDGARLLWMYLLPLPACILLGKKECLAFLLLSYLALSVVFLGLGGLPFAFSPQEMAPKNYSVDTRIRFLLSFSMISLMAYGYESLRRQNQREEEEDSRANKKRERSSRIPESHPNNQKHPSDELRPNATISPETPVVTMPASAAASASASESPARPKSLQKQNELLMAIMNNAPIAMYAKDLEGKYLFLNEKGLEWLRVSPEEISGKTDYDLFTRDVAEKSRQEDQEILRIGAPLTFERSQMIDRELFAAQLNKYPLFGRNGELNGVCGITYDISSYKQNEQKLQAWLDELEERVEEYARGLELQGAELKNFTETVPHELKAPLKDINQLTSMLVKNYATAFDRRGKEIVTLLVNRIKRINRYIDGIIQYAAADQPAEKEQQIDLNELIGEIVEQLAPPPEMQIWIEHTLPVIIAGKASMKQIFLNLLSNAITFMDTSYGEIAIDCAEHANYWTFAVVDNGPGIEQKYHEKIFRFFQTLAPKDERESAGIGLALVKKLVEHYGGQVWVESSRGKGAHFYFTLPKTSA